MLTAANTETVISHITKGQADIGFIEGPRQPRSVRGKVIGHDRLTVVVAPGHRWTRRRTGRHRAGQPGRRLRHQNWTCAGPCARSGTAPPARPQASHATSSPTSSAATSEPTAAAQHAGRPPTPATATRHA
jgi:DNA-binding transcriptional LysR family regulator